MSMGVDERVLVRTSHVEGHSTGVRARERSAKQSAKESVFDRERIS